MGGGLSLGCVGEGGGLSLGCVQLGRCVCIWHHMMSPPGPAQELSPPLVDDFVYLCDDAYTSQEVRDMEADLLATLNYDINIPVAYQFLRRYAKVRTQHG